MNATDSTASVPGFGGEVEVTGCVVARNPRLRAPAPRWLRPSTLRPPGAAAGATGPAGATAPRLGLELRDNDLQGRLDDSLCGVRALRFPLPGTVTSPQTDARYSTNNTGFIMGW